MKENKTMILRYAQLTFKRESLVAQEKPFPNEDKDELEKILVELGMSHEEILDRAAKNLIDEV